MPGWFGVGRALAQTLNEGLGDVLRRWYRDWPFFRVIVDDAQREMARARLEISAHLCRARRACRGRGVPRRHHCGFRRRAVRDPRRYRQEDLLDNDPVIRRSIELRNPYTDVLNLLQVELLRRYRAAGTDDDRNRLRRLLFLSINGIAAAMQSTG